MKELFKARREKRDILAKAQTILDITEKESRIMTESEAKEYTSLLSQCDILNKKIEYYEKLEEQVKTMPADNTEGLYISGEGKLSESDFPSSGWLSESGKPVKVYGHNDRMGTGDISVSKFVRGMLTGNWAGAEKEHKIFSSTTTNLSGGGYAIPDILHRELIDMARANSVLSAAGAKVVELEAGNNKILRVKTDPTAEVKPELQAFTGTSPAFDLVEFTPYTIGAYVQCSAELVDSAQNFEQVLRQVMTQAVASKLDYLGLRGAGSTEPIGIINTDGINTLPVDSFSYDIILDGLNELQNDNCNSANAYVIAPTVNNTLAKLKESVSGAYLQPPEDVKKLNKFVTTSMADSDLVLGDFTNLYLGLRKGITFDVSPIADDSFKKFAFAFRVILRADWAIVRPNHFCLCSTDIS